MFVVEVGAAVTLAVILRAVFGAGTGPFSLGYFVAIDIWLWLAVLFANFATTLPRNAAARRRRFGVARAYRRRPGACVPTVASKAPPRSMSNPVAMLASLLARGSPGPAKSSRVRPVDESAITGESAIREAGGDRSGGTGGTTVLSDRIVVHIGAGYSESFLDPMIALVESARSARLTRSR